MLKSCQEIYVRLPDEQEERILHLGLCLEWNADTAVVSISDREFGLEAGQDILLYFTDRSQFLQLAVRITRATIEGVKLQLELERQSDPISAEARETFRVTTLTSGIEVLPGGTDRRSLRDISVIGFGLVTSESYQLGQTLSVVVERGEDERYEGRACVHSIRKLRKGHVRFGFRALPDKDDANLAQELKDLTIEVQRAQLQRVT
ncbi:MAG: hypothetical protein IH881_11045 [Myxococcales bacterium]|nr:hypothetical protein [Myxococcales bacterium]